MRLLKQFAITAALTACSGLASPAPNLDLEDLPTNITLKVGETRKIGSTIVSFAEVRGDSRCPSDVVCVWAGNAEVAIGVGPAAGDGPTHVLFLNSTLTPHDGSALGLRVTFVELMPAPRSTDTKRDYRVTLRVERAS